MNLDPITRLKTFFIRSAISAACLLLIIGCSTEDDFATSPRENYDALWRTLDEGYCYFDLKLPPDSSWHDMYLKHLKDIRPKMSTDSLFRVLTALSAELKDGHVNVVTPFDLGRYWNWKTNYPSTLNIYTRNKYMGNDYRIAGGLTYRQISYNNHGADSIGLIVYESFMNAVSHSNINAALSRLQNCRAVIFDIRDNGGGVLTYADYLASHFLAEKTLIGYTRHKTGPAHDAFAPPRAVFLNPVDKGVRWLRPVVLLTDRGVYSSGNDFSMRMKYLPYVTLMGDTTGGGAGMPMSSELPNGWGVRYSAVRMSDAEDRDVELGIPPHYVVNTPATDTRDELIEAAIVYIRERYKRAKETGKWEK